MSALGAPEITATRTSVLARSTPPSEHSTFNSRHAEADKARKSVIEESNKAVSFAADTEKHIKEFKEQLDAAEIERVTKLVDELKEVAARRLEDVPVGFLSIGKAMQAKTTRNWEAAFNNEGYYDSELSQVEPQRDPPSKRPRV